MYLIFTYTDVAGLIPENKYDLRRILLPVPDEILKQPDAQSTVKQLAQQIRQLTTKPLHVSCTAIGLKDFMPTGEENAFVLLRNHLARIVIRFERSVGKRVQSRDITIPAPIFAPRPLNYPTRASEYKGMSHLRRTLKIKKKPLSQKELNSLEMQLVRQLEWQNQTPEQKQFVAQIKLVADAYLELINADEVADYVSTWKFVGFHPTWKDDDALSAHRRWETEQARLEKKASNDQ